MTPSQSSSHLPFGGDGQDYPAGYISDAEFARRQFHRTGRDRPDWNTITIYCCGDCGWRESIDQQCPGCGQSPVPVLYERQAGTR